ncbi:MFS transporter [Pelosinus sp. UFO1]|uniref:MFS transporter n=1 Tax=Pelosinus sp. UFO1 TaxID=484770 RepID=UPI0004D1FB85|nr:MFS transporter [Pelosinus sp. UFO1]AIF52991.1 major facilitator superfamily MFS_1 [Pelosinus sp. UFO1]
MEQVLPKGGFLHFTLLWFGEMISFMGSGLTGFALGVWVYQNTGSVTEFSLIALSAALPGIVFSPIVGALSDRWDRRLLIIVSDFGACLGTLAIILLLHNNVLKIWHIYIIMMIISIFSTFRLSAYQASFTMLIPKEQLGRANGMDQISVAISQILPPVVAGVLVGSVGIEPVILIDFCTYIFALAMLLFVRIPKLTERPPGSDQSSLLNDVANGWNYLTERPGLLWLIFFVAIIYFAIASLSVLITPLILSMAPVETLGMVMSIGGSGMLISSLLISTWGGLKQDFRNAFIASMIFGVSILIGGSSTSVPTITMMAFLAFFSLPFIISGSRTIFQKKTLPSFQGRIFAVRRMFNWAASGVAYFISGPLADYVFKPLLLPGGLLANNVGTVIGIGQGRGIGLFMMIVGLITIIALICVYPHLRFLEKKVPDAC